MPSIQARPIKHIVDERVALWLEPGQYIDVVPQLSQTIRMIALPGAEREPFNQRWRMASDECLVLGRLAIDNPHVCFEAAIDRDMYSIERRVGPWLGGNGIEGALLIVPVRMCFMMRFVNLNTRDTERGTAWLQFHYGRLTA